MRSTISKDRAGKTAFAAAVALLATAALVTACSGTSPDNSANVEAGAGSSSSGGQSTSSGASGSSGAGPGSSSGSGGSGANQGSSGTNAGSSSGGSSGSGGVASGSSGFGFGSSSGSDSGVLDAGSGSAGSDSGAGSGSSSEAGLGDATVSDSGRSEAGSQTGSSSGSGGSGSDSGSTSPGDTDAGCTVAPVTPNATQQTKNVLCYLYSQYGNHIISGQEENATGQPSGDDVEFDYVFATTGKYPAIRSFDVNNAGNDTRCLAQWNAGGLCMFGYHMGVANGLPDGYTSSETQVDINTVLTEGSDLNTTFKARMDKAAAEIQSVQAGTGVVIWRPFHEAGGTWFWWSKEGGAQYVRLWKYMFTYMTATKGLTNLLWLMPYDGTPDASFYPGKDYVDIGGADNYNAAFDYSPMTSIYDACVTIFGSTMPIALHECGPIPDPDQLQTTKTNWVFFNVWTDPYEKNDTTGPELQKVYNSSYVVTRDKMPNLR